MPADGTQQTTSTHAINVSYEVVKDGEIDFEATELRRLELNKTGTAEETNMRYFFDAINISPI
tara:strand:- start:127 stop:315 length:189 start_codon:yes stop_codon:yes gene_type:complete